MVNQKFGSVSRNKMKNETILRIGFDDTDSPSGMCTTYLAYKIVSHLIKFKVEFLDYPYLIRFNPNIPWKTRGNGAVGFCIKTENPDFIKKMITRFVKKYSDIHGGANPGLVFYENKNPPKDFTKFSNLALWKLISRKYARKFVLKNNFECFSMGNGQGLVGAIGAIGYEFTDHTFELISYRKKSKFGKKRLIEKKSVKMMQEKTYPYTFNSYDSNQDRILLSPHGPDPVFYGIRGENPSSILRASRMIQTQEKLDGYLIFKSNQGTADHLKNQIDVIDLRPYTSGTISGIVASKPRIELGGHVTFSINVNKKTVKCAVYKPTQLTRVANSLFVGDEITVGGGIRKASKNHKRILNIEFIEILKLAKEFHFLNPLCRKCNKRMKSKGKEQAFECVKCGKRTWKKILKQTSRSLKQQLYIPSVTSHRHLTRPVQRIGISNKHNFFDYSLPWIKVFKNQ